MLTPGRERGSRVWLLAVAGMLSFVNLSALWTDREPDQILLIIWVAWISFTLWRLSRFTRLQLSKDPNQLAILVGWLRPDEICFNVGSELRIEQKKEIILFFRGLDPIAKAKVRCQSENEAADLIGIIRGFYSPSQEMNLNEPPKSVLKPFTLTIIAINVLIFCFDFFIHPMISGQVIGQASDQSLLLLQQGALFPQLVREGEYWRLATSQFLHAGLAHVFMNMFALLSLGSWVEDTLGWKKMALIFFAAGFGGNLWAMVWLESRPLVGASGAIFGLFGAISWIVFHSAKLNWRNRFMPSKSQLTRDIVINFAISLLPFVSLAAHFGGFVTGWVMAHILVRPQDHRPNDHRSQDLT